MSESTCNPRPLSPTLFVLLAAASMSLCGCQTLTERSSAGMRSLVGPPPDHQPTVVAETAAHSPEEETGIRAATERSTNRMISYMTGREPENREKAKLLYREADQVFAAAANLPREQAKKEYEKAAKLFVRAGEAHRGSALEQDALLMAGESYFFADQLTDAEEMFSKLQKEHPRNRHNDRAAARLFEISQYWIETEKAGDRSWMPVNFFDPSRPFFDVDGHAIRVLDNIRYNDPTGVLSDDATMAAGVEKMRQGKYQDADEFFTDLRETFPDSEHQFNAHIMGLRCKLLIYAGPSYSGIMLDEAEKLLRQTRRRFPDRMNDPQLSDELAKIAAEIDFKKAEKLDYRGRYRERRKEYGAARVYYQEVLEKHPNTPFAAQARERLAAFSDLPDLPPKRFAWLSDAFPNERRSKPLILSEGGTVLR
ncbi:tetratricopeptide repeat protein [Roseimaritima ulvae]|uniref:Outer membrane protein assembly factor BamD n=1 Tax=Roseimaritima ulvae TaxID=980254 RepID=A0A5B9QRM6_9BACT|nr:tetratricopeptide repeat protein [Roseimaritima ulvae]QEG40340.1 Outer membrane protein assembly factor BamD [Roseimaritima ulvae]